MPDIETVPICICGVKMHYNGIWPWVGSPTPVSQGVGYQRFYCLTCTKEKGMGVGVAIPATNPPEWSGTWPLGYA